MKKIKDYSMRAESQLLIRVEAEVLDDELLIVNLRINANKKYRPKFYSNLYLVDRASGLIVEGFMNRVSLNNNLELAIKRLHDYKQRDSKYYDKQKQVYEEMKANPLSYVEKFSVDIVDLKDELDED